MSSSAAAWWSASRFLQVHMGTAAGGGLELRTGGGWWLRGGDASLSLLNLGGSCGSAGLRGWRVEWWRARSWSALCGARSSPISCKDGVVGAAEPDGTWAAGRRCFTTPDEFPCSVAASPDWAGMVACFRRSHRSHRGSQKASCSGSKQFH